MLAGGGTGGHLYPAVAIAEGLRRVQPDAEILFVGTRRGLECRVLPEAGWQLKTIAVRGLRRALSAQNLLFPFRLLLSLVQSARIVSSFKPSAVIGTGGYVSGPVLFAASLRGYPCCIQEQNVKPGATTKLLAKRADRIYLSYEESQQFFEQRQKLLVCGNPVRMVQERKTASEVRSALGLAPEYHTVLVFGGSQGAHSINVAVAAMLPELLRREALQLIWGTGEADYAMAAEKSREYKERVWVRPYIDAMQTIYQASDVVICRAGAITLSEIEMFGIPAILVPYPYAAGGHQEENARALEAHGAAKKILNSALTPERLRAELEKILDDAPLRKKMGERMLSLARPQATEKIVDSIMALAAPADAGA